MEISMIIDERAIHDMAGQLYAEFFADLMKRMLSELSTRFAGEVAEELRDLVVRNVNAGAVAADVEQMIQNLLEQKLNRP